ncbi:MAG TPA: hypothetical protein VG797_03845 [Phycisphaerales bacterium]|nr:hypothetical protein [Phycisphaerales bacterium]
MPRHRVIQVRRISLLLAAAWPVAAGITVLGAIVSRDRLASATTAELLALVGLFVLPVVTLWTMRAESRLRRRLARQTA